MMPTTQASSAHQRSHRISAAAPAKSSTVAAVCTFGRPGHAECSVRTASPNHTWSNPPSDRPLTSVASATPAEAATATATARPNHTRPRDGRPYCSRIETPRAASHSAVQGTMCGHALFNRVSTCRPIDQPTQFRAARTSTAIAAPRPHAASLGPVPELSIGFAFPAGCP